MDLRWIVLLLALIGGAYSVVLEILRYRSANNPTPQSVADVYDAETYQMWKRYSAEHCRLNIVFGIIACAVSLVMLFTNVYAAFASLFGQTAFLQVFAVILLEIAVSTVIGIVKSYISTMVIEQKYGFNRSTLKTFIVDSIRDTILSLVLSLGLALLMMGLHIRVGDWLIVLFAAVVFVITLIISFLYPFFSRIGNKFTPLEEGELKDRLMALLNKHGYKVKAIEVMDASRRTTKLNAYFTGFGKMKTIVLYDNLLNAMTPDEICAVFAHEMGHGLHKDVLKGQILNIGYMLLLGTMVWGVVREPQFYTAFGFAGVNYGFAYLLVGIGMGVLQPLMGLITNARSRVAEFRADRQAVDEGYGEAMISAFKKLAKDNFAHLAPSKINVVLEYSHPPLASRVEAIEKVIKKDQKEE